MIRTAAEALALCAERGALTLVATPGTSSLVGEVVGEKVRGSWWAHPKGRLIFRLATALEASPDVLVAKLCGGRVTFLHRRLWPALFRVVTDAGWRRAKSRGLPAAARRLLAEVEAAGELELLTRAQASARKPLEQRPLVLCTQEHTETGHHATRLRSWTAWAPAGLPRAAAGLGLAEAGELLAAAGVTL
jgi:hypothetical protein